MPYLSKIDVKNILDNAPPDLDKGKIVQSLIEQGNQLEGFDQIAPTSLTGGGSDNNDGLLTRIGKGIVKDVAQPFARAAVTGYDIAQAGKNALQATGEALRGDKQAQQQYTQQGFDELRNRNLPIVGETKPLAFAAPEEGAGAVARSALDIAGAGASAASNFIGGEGAVGAAGNLGKGQLVKAIGRGIGQGAVAGGLSSAGQELQNEDATAGSVAKSALKGVAGGAAVGGALTAIPAAGIEGYRLIRGAGKEVKSALAPDVEMALTKAIKPSANNTGFKDALKTAIPDIHETSQLTKTPVSNLESLAEVINTAKKRVWQTYQDLLGPNADATIDGNKIADAMVSKIDKRFASQNPGKVEKIMAIADTYRKPLSLHEAEDFLQSANNDLFSYYAKNKVNKKVALGDPETAYIVREAEALRESLYSKLNELTGTDAAMLKRKYGALTNIENELQKRINVANRQNPIGLGEQVSYVSALGDAINKSDTAFGVAKGAAKVTAARYLKNKNTPDVLVRDAFSKLSRVRK